MFDFNKPNIEITEISEDKKYGRFVVEPLERGYGTTLGNSLRRIMLSSLPGAAISHVKIDGVLHEFSSIPGVKEDVTEIVMNLKSLAIKNSSESDEPKIAYIEFEGEGVVTAADIQVDPDIEIMNPDAVIALCGCMPQAFPQKAIDVEEADIIIGSKGKGEILNLVNQFRENKERHIDIVPHSERDKFEELASETDALHTRAFLKIQDGCNRECAYCIIPKARGRVRSRPVDSIVAEAKKMAAAGHKEIVLTGVNISCYGQDLGNNVCDAIEAVAEIEDVKRVRLGSLELDLFTDEMLVLDDLSSDQFHGLLNGMQMLQATVTYKAVTTKHNLGWTPSRLFRELAAEHAALNS